MIPGNLINSSPVEFAFLGSVQNPLEFITYSFLIFFGIMVFWPMLLFGMASIQVRATVAIGSFVFALASLVNVLFFSDDYGTISRLLQFDNPELLIPRIPQIVIPIFIFIGVIILSVFLIKRYKTWLLSSILFICLVATIILSVNTVREINQEFTVYAQDKQNDFDFDDQRGPVKPVVSLSRTEKNVVILFLDRAIGSFFPIILDQFPELRTQYSGFIYYPNTVSMGAFTLTGAPAVMGGYEYSPDNIDKRDTERLVDKHNEASLVLPKIFLDANYKVSVFDPPYSNYQWMDDYTPFQAYPEIHVEGLKGKYSLRYKNENGDGDNWGNDYESRLIKRRLPMYSLFNIIFPVLRPLLYLDGSYFLLDENPNLTNYLLDSYAVLHYLPKLTDFAASQNTYTFLANDTTHDPAFLQYPEYRPRSIVTDRSTPLDSDTNFDEVSRLHYHANVAAILRIGEWLKYLQDNGAYDNTRIIIVSDHGRDIDTPAFADFSKNSKTLGYYNPLFLVKDFGAHGLITVATRFMTNGDTPTIAIEGLSVSQDNPFTDKNLFSVIDKSNVNCYFSGSSPDKHSENSFVFDLKKSFSVHDSIFKEENWAQINP